MNEIIIRGRSYQVHQDTCPEERVFYTITGKRGTRWTTLRNVNDPSMLFLVPEKGTSKTMDRVWLTDRNGILEVVSQ